MSSDLELVMSAELRLLDPAVRSNAAELDGLLDGEFSEIGASGRIWTRADLIVELVSSEQIDERVVSGMSARHVAEEVIVVEYTTSTPTRAVQRSSWWRRTDGGWRCYFHQGTPLPAAEPDCP